MAFSEIVQKALDDIYYHEWTGRGQEAFALLEQASEAGDGDASCLLARCLCGYQYVWEGHGFPEDDRRAVKLLHKSVEQGSALGALVSLRSGELPEWRERKMPFTLQEAFAQVERIAYGGDAFAQYVVGNAYFWWDFLRIQGKRAEDFATHNDFKAYLRENIVKCEDWFQKALRGGIYLAANNLNRYYREGDEDIILPQPEKAKDLYRIGAEYGHPIMQSIYAKDLEKADRKEEAFSWFQKAADGGEPSGWYDVGRCYLNGIGVAQDEAMAAESFAKGLPKKSIGCHNLLGKLYFNGTGVPQDYARAFRLLSFAYAEGSKWGVFYLGKCCFEGWGTPQDFVKAREFLEQMDWDNSDAFYMLGYIYGRGLGVDEDIPKAVAYLQKGGNNARAKEELLHYKKKLFGGWVHR